INAGEGGMIVTNNEKLADMAWSLANVGRIRQGGWYQHENIGWNLRMTEFQAAIVLAQLSRLEDQIQIREKNAMILDRLLEDIEGIEALRKYPQMTRHAYHIYMFKLTTELAERIEKDDFIQKVNAEGIPVAFGYHSLNQNEVIISETAKWTGER